MRGNVLDRLINEIPNARHLVVLTHNIDFLFIQSVLSRKLRDAGNPRLTIFADAMCASQSFTEQRAMLDGLGVRYRVVPVDLGAGRRFHPKALLLIGSDRAALAIGSGNLTQGGMAANHEAWTFAVSNGNRAFVITALREYLYRLVATLPLAQSLNDELNVIFDDAQEWVGELPPAAGVASTPSEIPLIDQIAQFVTGTLTGISIIAPYHDENAVALKTLAERFAAPVTCWMQRGQEAFSKAVAATLPANVTLKSIDCKEDRRPSLIHTKLIAFHREDDVVLAVGSANCSQAALLLGSWGNAELMAVDTIAPEVLEDFLSEVVRGEADVVLPDQAPSTDWEVISPHPLRVLAARHEGDRLEVAYHFSGKLTDPVITADVGTWSATAYDSERGTATFTLTQRVRTIELQGVAPGGKRFTSPAAWVDDEASLSAPAALRRVLRRIQEAEVDGVTAQAFQSVLELFRDYLRDPEAARRRIQRQDDSNHSPGAYDPAAVFSEDFGRVGIATLSGSTSDASTAVLSIIEKLFAVSREVSGTSISTLAGNLEDGDAVDPEAAQDAMINNVKAKSAAKISAQLRRALSAVEQALCEPKFVEARSPALLGADIALTAILLVKGLSDQLIDIETFRASTRKIWGTLFFGERGQIGKGTLFERMKRIVDPKDRNAFVAALASPRLVAALALWSIAEWSAQDANGLWFRFSAAQLHAHYSWLFAAAPPDLMVLEIQSLAAGLLAPNDQLLATRAWKELIRTGVALKVLEDALQTATGANLRTVIKSSKVGPSDLIWVNGQLGFPTDMFAREGKVKAQVRFLGQSSTSRFLASFLVPVREVIEANALPLPAGETEQILNLVESFSSLQTTIFN